LVAVDGLVAVGSGNVQEQPVGKLPGWLLPHCPPLP
jgi:hypothetical protein